ncbi:MAG: DUF2309 domain-containing protein [Sphingobacteriales bacterium JAD_PAG50586_3]|nr:MAG: DUF2309 domain-containing protein [Sphingobacteriales bacterium JAD_PAG50586_3]
MKTQHAPFNGHEVLHNLKHFLPAQAPLKDFIHHNTLHAFQHLKFDTGIRNASEIFGYNVSLSIDEYRQLYQSKKIREDVLEKIIANKKGIAAVSDWKGRLINHQYQSPGLPRIGRLRDNWKREFQIDLDSLVHPILFRVICSYLDQGISIWNFPVLDKGFLASLRELEKGSYTSFFKTERARKLLLSGDDELENLLHILVGDETLYEQYVYDQQFAHQGWSGMVAATEEQPQTLLDHKKITLHDFIVFELLLEIDALDFSFGTIWSPLALKIKQRPSPLFGPVEDTELIEALTIWQEAFEWTYYDEVLAGIKSTHSGDGEKTKTTFQAMFCIDDRECSLRRYIEKFDNNCETFGTPGFFGVEFYYKPQGGKFYTKLCPAPVNPKYLIKETSDGGKRGKEHHMNKRSHSLFQGWLISQSLGFWSAAKLFFNIFRPTMSPATASSFKHMHKHAKLVIENEGPTHTESHLQVGFTVDEMVTRVENLLKSIGLVKDFAPVVYVIGHGSSSVNNPHYAAYDCGACSGRAGSVNSRVLCYMANHTKVRHQLELRGINIPNTTQFVGGLHDTTRDEIVFFDEATLSIANAAAHKQNESVFSNALDLNAKERSRRFMSINTHLSAQKIHEKIRTRSVSLFEPRPELNHATNTLCVVGRRALTKNLFLDRRAFMNSFDYTVDPDGKYLLNILKAAAPVCGGINLEYYFSRVDNQKLGAGSKLPHNVMGLIGVANGIDGDLRPGLPSQMIEMHDPVRLMIIVEHFPDVVLDVIKRDEATYQWFINEWVHLVAVNPESQAFFLFKDGAFTPYYPTANSIATVADLTPLLESHADNLPIYQIAS